MEDRVLSIEEIKSNILYVREWLEDATVLFVRASDEYLSEYISLAKNDRYHLSGFTGSTGDMLITKSKAYLFLDGRYHIQGEEEACDLVQIVKLPLGVSPLSAIKEKLEGLVDTDTILLLDTRKISEHYYLELEEFLEEMEVSIRDIVIPNLPFRYSSAEISSDEVEEVPFSLTGLETVSKIKLVRDFLIEEGLDFFLFTALDEISYLFNIRSYSLPYSSVVRSIALVSTDAAYLFVRGELSSIDGCILHREDEYVGVAEELFKSFPSFRVTVSYDDKSTSHFRVNELRSLLKDRGEFSSMPSLVSALRQSKTVSELSCMGSAFLRADIVMKESIDYLNDSISNGVSITEKELYDKVRDLFFKHGARGLSFSPIVASGVNSACIHYTNASSEKLIESGEFVLLDIGAYWEGAYATDLTRTFVAGSVGVTAEQRKIYSLVLKSAVRLMSLCFPEGVRARELDSLVRGSLWSYGYSFAHGTGHGIGICVHETPPSISINSDDIIRSNMTFSVEPGIYMEGFGGVRIENIVTVKKSLLKKGWLCIEPLSFAPLDECLIDRSYFDNYELSWLSKYIEKTKKLVRTF